MEQIVTVKINGKEYLRSKEQIVEFPPIWQLLIKILFQKKITKHICINFD